MILAFRIVLNVIKVTGEPDVATLSLNRVMQFPCIALSTSLGFINTWFVSGS